jgi:2,5-diamino-6-(ribosylamino)-4(3H)-pyrimidinone 5'-phosphate reductase
MTHYLRSRHDAILIGVGTAVADNPGLNCRLEGVGGYGGPALQGQPRPIVLDPHGRWELCWDAKILQLARDGKGKAPYVIVAADSPSSSSSTERRALLESYGGKYIHLPPAAVSSPPSSQGEDEEQGRCSFDWIALLSFLRREEGIRSVMIEGGGSIINSLLEESRHQSLIDSVIVTIAPTWLGQGGVVVSPKRRTDEHGHAIPASRLTHVRWYPFGEDVVLCGRIKG